MVSTPGMRAAKVHFTLLCLVGGMAPALSQIPVPIKWACIGNSITSGVGGVEAYPARLAGKLGPAFSVQNDGVSTTTLLKRGDTPYWTKGKLDDVFAFKPDIITVKLGTNDTKPVNWQYEADFVKDLTALVDTFNRISSKPRIWLCLPAPIFPNTFGIRNAELNSGVIPRIKQVAAAKELDIIDLNTPLRTFPALFPDGVHPNDAGADSIASIMHRAFAAKATRVACIGNSITQYAGTIPNAVAVDAYPVKLNMLLGRNYLVQNAGVSGCYLLKPNAAIPTIMSYWNQGRLKEVFAFKPNVVTISLGTNDARPKSWNTAKYISDYQAMIDTLGKSITPKPQMWLLKPLPAWQINGQWPFSAPSGTTDNGISGNTIRDSVGPALLQVANARALPVIDLYAPFLPLKARVADGVHPDAAGQDTIAHILFRAFQGGPVGMARKPAARPPTRSQKARVVYPAGSVPRLVNGSAPRPR